MCIIIQRGWLDVPGVVLCSIVYLISFVSTHVAVLFDISGWKHFMWACNLYRQQRISLCSAIA